jgi:anti-sigma regulatory factor (Ser/Thr protein kinase)
VHPITVTLPRAADSVAAARRLVRAHAGGLGAQRRADAVLLVSELVTNALRHGNGAITLRIAREPHELVVEVADAGSGAVKISPRAGADDVGGWGLRIVDWLADDWGVRVGSTCVWFRLRYDTAPRR